MALRVPLPSGTVTLLFTDIEGSTQHWEQQRAAMTDALRRHDRLMRNAIATNGGFVFKAAGDEFCAVFSRGSDAVAAAIDAQRAIAAQDWSAIGELRVRMALHSGSADERDGDYFGPAVNRVARLLAIVHGGQVVASNATAQLLRGMLPEQTELRDLGEHRLRDLIEPERVWQLVAPKLPDEFPPLQSLGALPNNLPRQVTPLIGRETALAEIEPLVLEHAVVTLVGTGGVGKTRLALQAGADLLDGSGDGVWLVELAPLKDASLVVNTIASAFGLREQPSRPLFEVLIQYLHTRRLLLILDNCEHLVMEVARLVDAILLAAPQVRILATSREPLRIPAEQVYLVPSLAVPSGDSLTSKEAMQYGAIALFAERARASNAKFTLSDETAPIVAEVCRKLDGIALAIELAAARVKVLAPRQLAQKLDERFRVLTGGSRTALPRQQTMRALIDWSYNLLSDQEQRLFRRLAIFVGGWTLEAAQIIGNDETLDALDVTDLLSSLVEKSLVVAEVESDCARYRLLESTHAFASEKLAQSGEREGLARRHAQWAAELGDRADEAWWTVPRWQWQAEYEPELENARSAVDWALSHDEVVLAARILVGFWLIYRLLLGETEARGRLEAVLARLDDATHPALAARVWNGLSAATFGSRAIEAAQRAVELGERGNDPAATISGLYRLAFGLNQAGRAPEAETEIQRALRLSNEGALARRFHASLLSAAGQVAASCGRVDDARKSFAEGFALAMAVGDENTAILIRLNMAELEFRAENPSRALELVRPVEAQPHGPRGDDNLVSALINGAAYRIAGSNIADARAAAHKALVLARGMFLLPAVIAMQHLATVAALSGDSRCGALLRGYVDLSFRKIGYERETTEQRTYEILTTSLREQLGDAEIEALAAEGAGLSEDQAVAEALSV